MMKQSNIVINIKQGVRDPELGRLQQNLLKQYRKLWNLDHFHTIVIDGKTVCGTRPASTRS